VLRDQPSELKRLATIIDCCLDVIQLFFEFTKNCVTRYARLRPRAGGSSLGIFFGALLDRRDIGDRTNLYNRAVIKTRALLGDPRR
jgi:hypothetical protein